MEGKPQGDKEEYVRRVFAAIAHRYDFLNTVLSFNQDKYWRRFTIAHCGLQPGDKGLDVCCGTGRLTMLMAKAVGPEGQATGLDFSTEMLAVARKSIAKSPYQSTIELVEGNAMDLPFEDNAFACTTIGFALRNVPDIEKTIAEMRRVTKPGGRVVSLELAKPSAPVFKQLYYFYFNCLVPIMGRLGVGQSGPYSWLPESLKGFPHQSEIRDLFARVGLKNAIYHELTGGIVAVHIGEK